MINEPSFSLSTAAASQDVSTDHVLIGYEINRSPGLRHGLVQIDNSSALKLAIRLSALFSDNQPCEPLGAVG